MTQYAREELNLIGQQLLSIFLIAVLAFVFSLKVSQFPWWELIGIGIGLSIVVLCWSGTKYSFFVASLLLYTVAYSIIYNWSTIVQ